MDAQWDKVRKQLNAQTKQVQRPAQLLVAVESTLASTDTPTAAIAPQAYWVAFLSTLEQLAGDAEAAKPDSDKRALLEACLYLLALLVPFLDKPALRARIDILRLLPPLFQSFAAHAPAVKSLIALAQSLLASASQTQLERDLDGCRSVYATILSLCADARPKVRRRAQEAVQAVLASTPPPAVSHPYAGESAEWICSKLEEAVKGAKRAHGGGGKKGDEHGGDESRAIALLTFVKNLGSAWPASSTSTLLSIILSTLTLSSPHLTLSALTLLSHLFSASHAASSISDDHVRDTLEALVNAKPKVAEGSEQGEKLLAGWAEGVGEGMVALARSDANAGLSRTAMLFPEILPLLASAQTPALRTAVETSLSLMIRHCLTDADITSNGAVISSVVSHVEKAITSPRYAASAQPHVLALVKALFLRLRVRVNGEPAASRLLSKSLVLVAKAREDSRFEWKKEADAVLDAAVKILGPARVLELVPLNLDPSESPSKARAWLLPLLKPAITNTRLGHFRETFVPLSAAFFSKAEEARSGGRDMEAKVWETLVGQVWALLPGYCEYPTDLVESFDTDFVSLVANVVYTQSTLRPAVFKALQTLLTTTLTLANSTSPPDLLREQFSLTPADGKASLAHLRTLAQTILSVAFNVYGKMNRGEGGYVLETVGLWFSILPPDDLVATYERVEGLVGQALAGDALPPSRKDDPTIPPSHALLDILIAMIPHAHGAVARRLFDFAMQDRVLGCVDQAVQKKAYRILARLCEEKGKEVVSGREGEVIDKIVDGAPQVANGAKRDRVALLSAFVPLIPSDSLHIVPSLIPEAVLSTKESNGVTRESAYTLLVSMGQRMANGGRIKRHLIKGMEDAMEDEVDASEEEFVTMLSAGLAAANPHMIAATIGALGRLVWEFHTSLKDSYLTDLLETIVVFLSSANREIVKAGLGFVKVAVVTLESALVLPSLPQLVPALINWSHEHSNHFKVKIRHLLERMIRKYGYDAVERYVPEDDKKLVSNIRKRQARSKKKKAAAAAAGMDVDGEVEEDGEIAPRPQAAQRSAYDEVLYGSDSDVSASEDEEAGEGPVRHAPTGVKNRKSQARKAKKEEGGAFIQEGEDEVLDLLDEKMMSRISATRPAPAKTARKPLDSHFKADSSGRIRIEEEGSSDDDRGASTSAGANAGPSGMGDYLEAMRGEDGHTRDARGRIKFNKTQGKRARGDDFDDDDPERDVPVTEGLKELDVTGKKRWKKQKKEVQQVGGEFKAKRAGGDVKKNGMQPYAFVPLQQVAGKKSNQKGAPKVGITGLKRSSGKK
ncbi:putative Ribosomal protein [Rhodotorula toruloides ATCC 204091]|uniref:Putative ribosomal protein n=1 Tax=Rhodotorula toruloides TaxID=5286 RepID=A0A0K3CI39_RHOTO|nr:putative Ribosomal protein [Rhodotorula toruloides ATCC 204091]KAK4329969.1 Ribosomal RNA-processing protein 12 [Rhodotorula toruloides]PRQ71960.1 putative ribosomal protein [Rhodotorula toruloides]